MKKLMIIQIFLIFLMFGSLTAQNQLKEDDVKTALTKIFDLCKEQNYSGVSTLLLNSEDNQQRSYNYSDQAEAKTVKRLAKKIKAYIDLSDSYEYESLNFVKLSNLSGADLKVNFKSGDQQLTISFTFVDLSGKILLSSFK